MDIKHKILDGAEPFEFCGSTLPATVKDFWAWAMSRLIADGPRGDLAEFIVNTALGMDMSEPKRGWGECDIVYPYCGKPIRIEVKCSTFLQAWERGAPSKPTFSISKTYPCDIGEVDGSYRYVGRGEHPDLRRRSDIYVFCLFAEVDRAKAWPLKLDQWRFFIVPTAQIDAELGDQRRISLQGLDRLRAAEVNFGGVKATIDAISEKIISQ